MRVAVVGGYGVFGERLCRLLARDGHEVIVCGRDSDKAAALAAEIGGQSQQFDLTGDLAPLFAAKPGAVVDAAGPYQAYGDDPYRLARAAIMARALYLDLSDDAAFTAGIATLDDAAKQAGVFALSGASSTPGLSSAVAAELAQGVERVERIETAILPGNRAPRGRAVMVSILEQVGAPLTLTRGGLTSARGWSGRKVFDLGEGLRRSGYLIGSPEAALFPKYFNARSSVFRAGLELGAMNAGLAALSLLRRWRLIGDPVRLLRPLRFLAGLMRPFGTDRGGMVVELAGRAEGRGVLRRWRLIAGAGEGPFIPAVVARAILRAPEKIAPGARPCLAPLPLAALEDAMSDLAVTTARDESRDAPLFQRVLGPGWARLPEAVREGHEVWDRRAFTGRARIDRGGGLAARLIAALFRFPSASEDAPVRVKMERRGEGEKWTRVFAGKTFTSRLTPAGRDRVFERFGPFRFELDLPMEDGALRFVVRRGWLLGVPLPARLLPVSNSKEREAEGRFHFDVALHAPLGLGLIVRYRGRLRDAG